MNYSGKGSIFDRTGRGMMIPDDIVKRLRKVPLVRQPGPDLSMRKTANLPFCLGERHSFFELVDHLSTDLREKGMHDHKPDVVEQATREDVLMVTPIDQISDLLGDHADSDAMPDNIAVFSSIGALLALKKGQQGYAE